MAIKPEVHSRGCDNIMSLSFDCVCRVYEIYEIYDIYDMCEHGKTLPCVVIMFILLLIGPRWNGWDEIFISIFYDMLLSAMSRIIFIPTFMR